jgi:hypothetical protein
LPLGDTKSGGSWCVFCDGVDEGSGACHGGTLEETLDNLENLVFSEGGKTEKMAEVGEIGNMERKTLTLDSTNLISKRIVGIKMWTQRPLWIWLQK